MSRVPLDYASERPRRRIPVVAILLVLVIVMLLGVIWLLIERERQTRAVLMTIRLAQLQAQAQVQAMQAATQEAPPASPGQNSAAESFDVTLTQRESRWVAEIGARLLIGDITGGQVEISLHDEDENLLLGPASAREGDEFEFTVPSGTAGRLEVRRLVNVLVGDDTATFRISFASPATRRAPPAAPRAALSEHQKVDLLLARILAAEGVVFIRNDSDHSAEDAAGHLQMKWEQSGGAADPSATAIDFIDRIASRSSLSGEEYRVRLPDGREVPSGQWLRALLREIESGAGSPATRPATQPAPDAPDALQVSYDGPPAGASPDEPMNLPLPTLGGKQLWTDVRIDPAGWRIQQHALTGHHRLLDDRNRRQAWGSREQCEQAWQRLVSAAASPRDPRTTPGRDLVVLLHGLGRSRAAMEPMARFLREQGYDVVNFGYASTRGTVGQHAQALAEVLSHLQGYRSVHFVGHSLGGIVVRRYLAMEHPAGAPPVGRVVMLAPPNSGSQLAIRLKRNPVFLVALGPVGQEIAEWQRLEASLATPRDFGVIAGDCSRPVNPLLDGAGDLVVTVDETKLEGMADFLCMDVSHTFLMRNGEVIRRTLSFLRSGTFEQPAAAGK